MEEIDRHNLRDGSRVKMLYENIWLEGEVTIVRETNAKVLFDSHETGPDLDYDYYPIKDLEFIEGQN